MPVYGVISGSGLYEVPGLEIKDTVRLKTPYGEPSDNFSIGSIGGKKVVFLPRHGASHKIQPHRINYRANIWGLKNLGAERIVSLAATGGISRRMKPGIITMPHQIIDTTSGRASTFYDEDDVVHIDFTEPFCPDMRIEITKAAAAAGIETVSSGVYVCVNGPRLETAAEIGTYASWGADMVGMTAMPEAALARELEMCYVTVSVITNSAAGISHSRLTTKEVVDTMKAASEKIKQILKSFFERAEISPTCSCRHALKDARL